MLPGDNTGELVTCPAPWPFIGGGELDIVFILP